MNFTIRITQILLALFALNGLYGLVLQLALSPFSSRPKPSAWLILGSIVTALTIGFIIFLLQRYYEIRNSHLSTMSDKKFAGIALTSASIAVLIGVSVVIIIVLLPFLVSS